MAAILSRSRCASWFHSVGARADLATIITAATPTTATPYEFQMYLQYDILFERLLDLNQWRPSLLAHIYIILSR